MGNLSTNAAGLLLVLRSSTTFTADGDNDDDDLAGATETADVTPAFGPTAAAELSDLETGATAAF